MTTTERDSLLQELNATFNETVKYMQFRFNELAAKINQVREETKDDNPKV